MSNETSIRAAKGREPQLDLLVKFMIINLLAGLTMAAVTSIFHNQIVAHQLAAATPGAVASPASQAQLRNELSATLWSRPGAGVIAALFYPLLIRRLRSHDHRGWRRTVLVAVIQFLSLAWFVIGSAYPWWLHGVQAIQLIVVSLVFVAAIRPTVRALFVRPPKSMSGNVGGAWLLVVLTPVVAELALGTTPITLAWLVILWIPVYGAGVLLIRELVCRAGRGWASLILLGFAYEIVEDGIGLQALTSPHLYNAAHWGLRVLGLNLPYWEFNAVYHVVFTVLIPITLTNLVFPAHRARPYLTRGATWWTAIVAVLGVGIVRLAVPPSQDPGYQAPIGFLVGCGLAVLVLGVVALRILPHRCATRVRPSVPLPKLRWWYLGAGVTTLLVFVMAFPILGAPQPAFTTGSIVVIPMILALLVATAGGYLLYRASASPRWTDRHTLAIATGALVAHTVGGMLHLRPNVINYVGLAVILVVTILLTRRLDRNLQQRGLHRQVLLAGP